MLDVDRSGKDDSVSDPQIHVARTNAGQSVDRRRPYALGVVMCER